MKELFLFAGIVFLVALAGCPNPAVEQKCNDGIHFLGDIWDAEDGCNTCRCSDEGVVHCTEMACNVPDQPTVQNLTLAPGESIEFVEGLNIKFGRAGTEFSVPDIVFGDDYILNNPGAVNYLPVNNYVKLYKNGKIISLKKKSCEKEFVISDVPVTRVLNCTIETEMQEAAEPQINLQNVNEVIDGDYVNLPSHRPDYVIINHGVNVSSNPLLYLGMPEFVVQEFPSGIIVGGPPNADGGADYSLGFIIVTNFGVSEIIYKPDELFDQVKKEIDNGYATISIKPQKNSLVGKKFSNSDITFTVTTDFKNGAIEDPAILEFEY